VLEKEKWAKEQLTFEDRIATLEHEIHLAQQTYVQLDDQKQENMLLKETIDRMRFDMDEMRSNAANSVQQGGSGTNSAKGSLRRNFEDEMIRAGEKDPLDDPNTSGETEVPHNGDEDAESEDYIQTIITKTRKRVNSLLLLPRVISLIPRIESARANSAIHLPHRRNYKGIF
jgi:hypothetical protein